MTREQLAGGYALLVEKGVREPLVIAGRKGWMYADIFRVVVSLGLRERVIFTGYVPGRELPYLYNAARIFVYPSIYEGFGLPVLEAMACGTPVVTSNVSSMPEVAAGAAILTNPSDHKQMASSMEAILADECLRQSLRERGLRRAAEFSWERTARETLQVYFRACEK